MRSALFPLNSERWARVALLVPTSIAAVIVLGIGGFALIEAWPAIRQVGLIAPLTDSDWQPLSGVFGMAPMLLTTLLVSLGALLLAAPLGVGAAVFARVWAPRPLSRALRAVQILLAGLPSVVYGAWGLTVLVPMIGAWRAPGASMLAAMIVLALMILPTIALSADAAIAGVSRDVRCGAAALGLRSGAALIRVTLPAAKRGIFAGFVLAFGRALGETMAVLMVAGNRVQWPSDLFASVRTLTANIALEMGYAGSEHRAVLFLGGLFLLAMVAVLVFVGDLLRRKEKRCGSEPAKA